MCAQRSWLRADVGLWGWLEVMWQGTRRKQMPREAREQKEVVSRRPENLRGDTPIFFSFSKAHLTGQYSFKNKEKVI